MSDYYELIFPAISALPKSTSEARQLIYANARTALVTQLRSIQPVLLEEDIQSEIEALEEAIGRIERDVAGKANDLSLSKPSVVYPTEQAAVRSPSPSIYATPKITISEEIDLNTQSIEKKDVFDAPLSRVDAGDRNKNISQSAKLKIGVESDVQVERKDVSTPTRINLAESKQATPKTASPSTTLPPPVSRKAARSGKWMLALLSLLISVAGIFALLVLNHRDNGLLESRNKSSNIQSISPEAGKTQKQLVELQDSNLSINEKAEMSVASLANPDTVDHVYPARVTWHLEIIDGESGSSPVTAVRGDVDIPDARMKVTLLFRKNADPTFSASHIITIIFIPESAKSIGDVRTVGPLEMRRIDAQSGERLSGVVVPISRNNFMFGLMRGESEKPNIKNLRSLPLIDLPLQLSDGRMATINLLKGNSGSKLFAEGIDSWSNAGDLKRINH